MARSGGGGKGGVATRTDGRCGGELVHCHATRRDSRNASQSRGVRDGGVCDRPSSTRGSAHVRWPWCASTFGSADVEQEHAPRARRRSCGRKAVVVPPPQRACAGLRRERQDANDECERAARRGSRSFVTHEAEMRARGAGPPGPSTDPPTPWRPLDAQRARSQGRASERGTRQCSGKAPRSASGNALRQVQHALCAAAARSRAGAQEGADGRRRRRDSRDERARAGAAAVARGKPVMTTRGSERRFGVSFRKRTLARALSLARARALTVQRDTHGSSACGDIYSPRVRGARLSRAPSCARPRAARTPQSCRATTVSVK